MYKSFDVDGYDGADKNMFFDAPVSIARYDIQKYRMFETLTEQQMGFFWKPDEVDVSKDAKDFRALSPHEQHIFTSNLKRQIVLDSVQGRAPSAVFGPLVSLPELENWICTWVFSEQVHSRSYTHIIRNIYSDPSEVFDGIKDIKEIVDCAESISRHYDNLARYNEMANIHKEMYGSYQHKKLLWLALQATNALEGLRFYVSFACSWAFYETKKSMEGNAKIIKLICRDENLHLASTVYMIKTLPREDADFAKIRDECHDECVEIYEEVAEQEKDWAKYLFKDGSMVGLNESMLCDYVEWLAGRRMKAVGLATKYPGGSDPLPWTKRWISGSEVQVAPQETEITSYKLGGITKDISDDTFKEFEL
jgi:ribonucleoside-diphosphate reductase beta chain